MDKRNKGLGTEIILYCLRVRKAGPGKLNCLTQHCIRIIWQEWEANGEHQYPLHGSACPFSSTNSFLIFLNQEAAQAQDSSGLFFLYITLLLFSSSTGAFGFWGLWGACVPSTAPEWNTPLLPINQLCFFSKISRPQMHKSVSTHISADCFHLVQELLHILP